MAITLEDTSIQRTSRAGAGNVTLSAGQTLKIEATPGGPEILEATVPEGKVWNVGLSVHVSESEA